MSFLKSREIIHQSIYLLSLENVTNIFFFFLFSFFFCWWIFVLERIWYIDVKVDVNSVHVEMYPSAFVILLPHLLPLLPPSLYCTVLCSFFTLLRIFWPRIMWCIEMVMVMVMMMHLVVRDEIPWKFPHFIRLPTTTTTTTVSGEEFICNFDKSKEKKDEEEEEEGSPSRKSLDTQTNGMEWNGLVFRRQVDTNDTSPVTEFNVKILTCLRFHVYNVRILSRILLLHFLGSFLR